MSVVEINNSNYQQIYFVGIGGIGMSALARYFKKNNWKVAGYDKTETVLTKELVKEGIDIHFEDSIDNIPYVYKDSQTTLVVYTPAINFKNSELNFFKENGFQLLKRSQVLGFLTRTSKGLCVAGTHGKTTTSTLLAHLLDQSELKCNAFLGGIASNFNSNLVINTDSNLTVIEADEFDRSFLQLHPFASIITSTDADHLDIYGDKTKFLEGFQEYANLISEDGFAIVKNGLELSTKCKKITYSVNDKSADAFVENIRFESGKFLFDIQFKGEKWFDIEFGQPGIHNAENALACILFCIELGLNEDTIRTGLKSFKGVKRRFEYHVKTQNLIYIDDYAHHPTEINALISSLKLLYPDKKITAIFQPHLFSRTKDFMDEFAKELSKADEIYLMSIYPAREEPIEGITSEVLAAKITSSKVEVLSSEKILEKLNLKSKGVITTIGAGNIDLLVPKITQLLEEKI